MPASERKMFARGLAVLVAVIFVGLIVAESQLNSLTQRQEHVQVLNLKRNETTGTYTAYAFGNSYALKALFPVAGVSNTDNSLTIESAGRRWTLPTRLRADWRETAHWLDIWRRQFVGEALKFKQALSKEMHALKRSLGDAAASIRQLIRQ